MSATKISAFQMPHANSAYPGKMPRTFFFFYKMVKSWLVFRGNRMILNDREILNVFAEHSMNQSTIFLPDWNAEVSRMYLLYPAYCLLGITICLRSMRRRCTMNSKIDLHRLRRIYKKLLIQTTFGLAVVRETFEDSIPFPEQSMFCTNRLQPLSGQILHNHNVAVNLARLTLFK